MCGLSGYFSFAASDFRPDADYLARMRDTMAHRGPDGSGLWISPDGKVGLAHRRLSIIDLSPAAAQPMSGLSGNLQLAFNGEIYNHAEIRAELVKLGDREWKTDHSDTEVILHAFARWGIDCVQRFRGMFAFALWDARERALWLARDRIGIKPLYYSVHHGRIAFASEIKALLEDPDQERAVDEDAFFHYLSFLTTPAPATLFRGIRKLPPATWLRVGPDGSLREGRYWDALEQARPWDGAGEGEVCERILSGLREAVALRKVSDVPVGVFLSGGIDSSTNAALFSEGEGRPVDTFTIGYRGENAGYRNETGFARSMAERIGARHHELLLGVEDLLDFLPKMVRLQDEPIADPVCVPVYYVSKLARESGVTVCQLGEGADELFWGYPRWKQLLRLQRIQDRTPAPFRPLARQAIRVAGRSSAYTEEVLRRLALGQPAFWGGAEAFTHAEKLRLLSPRLRAAFAGRTSWEALEPIWNRFREKAWERKPLPWMTYLDLNFRLPELLLMRVDKMSMGVGLEGRVPFLDHKFVEMAMGLPEALKTKGGVLKYLLKRSVRGLIPDELIDRKKQGFGVPVNDWVLRELGERARADLTDFCRRTDFLDAREALGYLERGDGTRTWYLLNFALWWKEFIGP